MTASNCPACGAPLSSSNGSCNYCGAAVQGFTGSERKMSELPVDQNDGFSIPESDISEPIVSSPLAHAARAVNNNPFPEVSQIPAKINMGRVNNILSSAKKYLIFILIAIILFCISCTVIAFVLFAKN